MDKLTYRIIALCAVGVCLPLTAPALAQDNVEGPWGIANGDIYGRARSADIPLLFGTGTGAQEAWRFAPGSVGSARPGGWGSIVFDAAGNLYFRTTLGNNKLTSVAPDGTHRWNARNAAGTADYVFGSGWNSTSPIVGAQRVYALGAGGYDPFSLEPVIAAFNKADGSFVWETLFPGEFWSDNQQLSPVLYNGKIYVVGQSGGASAKVYQIDAASGAIDWSNSISVNLQTATMKGTMALVPDAFASGVHGLYFNGDSGAGNDGLGEAYGVRIDTGAGNAALAWERDAGKATRSHVIYNPMMNRVYTHTWTDYTAGLFAFDPVTGVVTPNGCAATGHGFYDVGALDWDDASIVAGGFSGTVARYTDNGTGATSSDFLPYTNWWGEYRVLGQLLQDKAGNSILVSGTNSRVNDPPPGSGPPPQPQFQARAVILNLSAAVPGEDTEMFMDDIEVLEGPNLGNLTTVFSDNFEALSIGALPGQGGWEDDRAGAGGAVGPAQVVSDPTGGGQGKVVRLDPAGNCGGYQGMFHNFPDTTQDVVVIRYRQYRNELTENVWPYFGDFPDDFSEGWAFGWDVNGKHTSYQFEGLGDNRSLPQTAGVWQTVTITYDFFNIVSTIDIDGTTSDPTFHGVTSIRGFGQQVSATGIISGGTPNASLVTFDTGIVADHGFTLRGGPLIGPDGKMYYFHSNTGELVALRPTTIKCDSNCDGDRNGKDVGAFVTALLDPAAWMATYTCNYVGANDANNDGAVNVSDVGPFVNGLIP